MLLNASNKYKQSKLDTNSKNSTSALWGQSRMKSFAFFYQISHLLWHVNNCARAKGEHTHNVQRTRKWREIDYRNFRAIPGWILNKEYRPPIEILEEVSINTNGSSDWTIPDSDDHVPCHRAVFKNLKFTVYRKNPRNNFQNQLKCKLCSRSEREARLAWDVLVDSFDWQAILADRSKSWVGRSHKCFLCLIIDCKFYNQL